MSEGLDRAFRYRAAVAITLVTIKLIFLSVMNDRNLPGVELTLVDNLSLLDLAPGGHLGRFIIWTKGAFEKLDSLFGTYDESAKFKSGFNLPRSMMTNADLARIMYVLHCYLWIF